MVNAHLKMNREGRKLTRGVLVCDIPGDQQIINKLSNFSDVIDVNDHLLGNVTSFKVAVTSECPIPKKDKIILSFGLLCTKCVD